ncbi:MAG: penicillin-binding protein 1C, partial [Flavobacteriia bacterium]|nr:penicillin-binding protein 1C [Flavobacteriia bacterium]
KKKKGKTIQSTIHHHLQEKIKILLENHSSLMQDNLIYNGAVMITSVKTGEVITYVGNTQSENNENGNDVNCIKAPRSTGSILKPLLYAKSLEDGILTPSMLVTDIPSQFGGFSPKNFAGNFEGAIPANMALSRSLNIPMVHLLNNYGLSKFHRELKSYGLTTLNKPASHYGLSLILGGAEATLYDLSKVYTQMAQELEMGKSKPIKTMLNGQNETTSFVPNNVLKTDLGCIYSTFEAMTEVNRPDEDNNWKFFNSEQKIAWKTGTSFGFRDAWAIGITPDYVVAVWIGNADGEGRPGLTGINAAAPFLFQVFRTLPTSEKWFKQPYKNMSYVSICHESGHRASKLCPNTHSKWIPKTSLNSIACPYHQLIHLNKYTNLRVDSDCEDINQMKHVTWFVLPSIIEKFYKTTHPNYISLPEYKPECLAKISDKPIAMIYPKPNSRIYIPIDFDGKIGKTIFEATHRNEQTKVYWHLDNNYLGETKEIHQMALNPSAGDHQLTLIDENGISTNIKFTVIGKRR